MLSASSRLVRLSSSRLPPGSVLSRSISPQQTRLASSASKWKFWKKGDVNPEPTEQSELTELELYQQHIREMEVEARKEAVQSKRNKSRLSASHRQILHGNPPHEGLKFEYNLEHKSKEFKRAMLAQYGMAKTGVNPGISWPDDRDLELARQWEALYQERALADQIKEAKEDLGARKAARIAREDLVEANLAKMGQQVKQWQARVGSRTKLAEAEKERREQVLGELRAEFGYNVNPEDSYMAGRIAEREKTLIKEEKEIKKALKKERAKEKAGL